MICIKCLKVKMNNLICGDTLTELKKIEDNIFDIGITSPPYNKGDKNKGKLVDKVIYSNSSDSKGEMDYQIEQINVLNELYRITKPGGSFFYNHKIRWVKGQMLHPILWLNATNWTIRQEIIWNRQIAANIRGWRFWQIEERIYWLYKPINNNKIGKELQSKHALLTSVWNIRPEQNNPHPAPFPIELTTRAIYAILDNKQGSVIDPYCGSGTSLVSAKLLGHDYLGIDISQEYLDLAKQRLENISDRDKEKFEKEISLHKVEKTFKERKNENTILAR